MQSDLPLLTRDDTLLSLARAHLKAPFSSLDELELVNVSGMSNVTYSIASKKLPSKRIIIRFFESKCADFMTEDRIFRLFGERGWGPKEIERSDTYRVEEFIDGRPLTMFELRNPYIGKKVMALICNTNYDAELNQLIRTLKNPESNFSTEFVNDKKQGWFNRFCNEIRPQLQ